MLVNAEGVEITEPITPEEAEKLVNAAADKTKTEYETKMADLNKQLETAGNPALRKKAESATKEKDDLTKQIDALKGSFSKSILDATVAPLGLKEEDKKKLLEAYARLKPTDETDASAVAAAVRDAFKLTSDVPMAGAAHAFTGGFGGATPSAPESTDEIFTPEVKSLGAKMGLTEADYKKYSNKVPPQFRK